MYYRTFTTGLSVMPPSAALGYSIWAKKMLNKRLTNELTNDLYVCINADPPQKSCCLPRELIIIRKHI